MGGTRSHLYTYKTVSGKTVIAIGNRNKLGAHDLQTKASIKQLSHKICYPVRLDNVLEKLNYDFP